MRRLALVSVVALILGLSVASPVPAAASPSISPYRQLAAWIDVFDYAPRLQAAGATPRVTPDSVSDMAALGVRTLYVQVANPDGASPTQLTDRTELRALIARAHDRGIAVVPWFLPSLTNVADDVALVRQIEALDVGGERIDGFGLDLEATAVADVALRNRRTVDFARRVRKVVGASTPVAAIVYPALQLEALNTALWPNFPYRKLGKYVDVWMPMAYYTFRSTESGYRSAFAYSVGSVDLLRKHLGDAHAPVHLVGGLAEESTPADYLDMVRAARATDAVGWSVYDYATTGSWAWPYLRGDVPVPPTTPSTSSTSTSTTTTSTTSTSTTTSTTTPTAAASSPPIVPAPSTTVAPPTSGP
jgi:hypothetical protein